MTQMQWQPIETAPRDGTKVLLTSVTKGAVVALGSWWPKDKDTSAGPWLCNGGTIRMAATHWMPLPPPPETARSEP